MDYAGLFPPASLGMPEAVAQYASYLISPDAWMLGRLVVPVSRLNELAAALAPASAASGPWKVSAVGGEDYAADAARIATLGAARAGSLVVDVVEVKAATTQDIERAARALSGASALYVEVSHRTEPREALIAVKSVGARAKIRTGGITPDAMPSSSDVARFIFRCAEVGVAFKATAGLHHPLRGEHPLTYASDSPTAMMFGFLNVFLASAFARAGADENELHAVLEERSAAAFVFGDEGVRWRSRHLPVEQLASARRDFAVAFGSCSFREPVDELRELVLL